MDLERVSKWPYQGTLPGGPHPPLALCPVICILSKNVHDEKYNQWTVKLCHVRVCLFSNELLKNPPVESCSVRLMTLGLVACGRGGRGGQPGRCLPKC